MAKRRKTISEALTAEPSPEEIAAVQQMQPLQVPEWYASGAQVVFAGNDIQLIFNKPVLLGEVAHGGAAMSKTVGMIAPVGLVRMSIATFKDLSVLLAAQVEKREAEIGPIETEYTKQLAASGKKH